MKILQSVRSIIDDRTFLIFTSLHVEDMLQQRYQEGHDEELHDRCLDCRDMWIQSWRNPYVSSAGTLGFEILLWEVEPSIIHLFKECSWYTKCFYHFHNNKKFPENVSWADSHKTFHIKNEFSTQGIIHSRTAKNSTFGQGVGVCNCTEFLWGNSVGNAIDSGQKPPISRVYERKTARKVQVQKWFV